MKMKGWVALKRNHPRQDLHEQDHKTAYAPYRTADI